MSDSRPDRGGKRGQKWNGHGSARISHETKKLTGRGETFNMPIPGPGRNDHAYPAEVRGELLQRIADGETLKAVSSEDGMPSATTVRDWRRKDPDFAGAYEEARRHQAESLVDMAIDAAAGAHDKDSAMAARVQTETYTKAAALLDPRRFNPRTPSTGAISVQIVTNLGRAQPDDAGEYRLSISADDDAQHPQIETDRIPHDHSDR